ncbi:MAG: outer-membrane lipoprotein carrier protein LolA [Methylocystis sp.]
MKYATAAALIAALSFAFPAAAANVARGSRPAKAASESKAVEAPPAAESKAGEAKPGETKSKSAETKPAAPAAQKSAKPAAQGSAPAVAGATIAPTPSSPEPSLTRAEALKRANAFFNASPVMTADFVQIGGDGKRSEGRLHVQRAGRVRFEYAQPATMEVVADGAQVAVRDRKLGTQDLYFITQTPLKFLMKDKIDLEKDVTVEDVKIEDSGVTIFIEDKATFGGTSHVRLIFDPKTFKLKQWQVKDPQGYETLISIFNIDQAKIPDSALFKINK